VDLQPGVDDRSGDCVCIRRGLLAFLACLAVHFTYDTPIEEREQDENIVANQAGGTIIPYQETRVLSTLT
jgi:hypothetical protein